VNSDKKKILLIDDAEFILESTSTLLTFEGYDCYTAEDGEKGLVLAFQILPDIILCDIAMPKLDGYGVLDKIRNSKETESIPFIFLTAFTEKSNLRAAMERGADDFLVKPYSRDELIAAIDAQWNKYNRITRQLNEKVEEVGKSVTSALPHEFRTVLNEVIGSAKYLNSTYLTVSAEEIRELSQDIIISSNRLLKITENFLIFVRIESFAANPLKKRQLRSYFTEEPSALFLDIAGMKSSKYNRTGDLVISDVIDQITIEIATESYYKIVEELLDNAFKFSKANTEVTISSWNTADMVYFMISDFGRGMSREQISNIAALAQFERSVFEQQGLGLGLVIAKRLVELHDGKFNIKSVEGVGTTISFGLYLKK